MTESEGLVVAFLLDGGGGGREMDWDKIQRWQPGDGVIWIHLNYAGLGAQHWLLEKSGLEPLTCAALLAEDTRPRCTQVEEALLINLRGVNLNPGADPEDMVGVRIWIEENRIITTRFRKLLAISDIREEIGRGDGPHHPDQFLASLIAKLARRVEPVIQDLNDVVDGLEENIPTGEMAALRQELSDTRRQVISLRRYLAPQQEVLLQLEAVKIGWLSTEQQEHIRETAEKNTRYVEELTSLRDRTSVAQDEFENRASDEINKTMVRLTLVATIMMPLSLLTGLLGVNVAGIPAADKPWAFVLVVGLLVVFGGLELLLLRWLKWI